MYRVSSNDCKIFQNKDTKKFCYESFLPWFLDQLNVTCIGIFYFKQISRYFNVINAKTSDFQTEFISFISYCWLWSFDHALDTIFVHYKVQHFFNESLLDIYSSKSIVISGCNLINRVSLGNKTKLSQILDSKSPASCLSSFLLSVFKSWY